VKQGDLVEYRFDGEIHIGLILELLGHTHTMRRYMVMVLWNDGIVEQSHSRFLKVISAAG